MMLRSPVERLFMSLDDHGNIAALLQEVGLFVGAVAGTPVGAGVANTRTTIHKFGSANLETKV